MKTAVYPRVPPTRSIKNANQSRQVHKKSGDRVPVAAFEARENQVSYVRQVPGMKTALVLYARRKYGGIVVCMRQSQS